MMTGITTQGYGSLTFGGRNLHPAVGGTNVTQANRVLEDARAKITQLMFDTNAADRQAMAADISGDEASFINFMDQAARVNTTHASNIKALESRGQQLLASDCSRSIELGTNATSAADLLSAQTEFLKSCAPGFNGLVPDMLSMTISFKNFTGFGDLAASKAVGSTIQMSYFLTLGGLALVMLGGFFPIRAWVVAPVKALQGVMGRLSGGDLQAKVNGTDRKDEIGGMARTVQLFKDAGIEKLRVEGEAEAQRAAAE